jgi:hypothetical protein
MPIKKIVYLFGAGATHAEIMNLEDSPSETFKNNNGLLISSVSRRVMRSAQSKPGFKNNVEFVTAAEGSLNIELLISLLASSQIPGSDSKVANLKRLVREDIESILSQRRKNKFYLHKALLELHDLIDSREELLGVISLNYDDILDDAYKSNNKRANYCCTYSKGDGLPLLKLHGSFNWPQSNAHGPRRELPIIPLGVSKNYLNPPYNFIWGGAFDLLVRCDILRIIGCSLSQNDTGLLDLLFKAHLERRRYFEIQIIDFQAQGDWVKNNYGFFPGIVKPKDIEDALIADESILNADPIGNPFKIWLNAKAHRLVEDKILETKFLKKLLA